MLNVQLRPAARLLAISLAGLFVLSAVAATRPSLVSGSPAAQATPTMTPVAASVPAIANAFITIQPESGFPLDPFLISVQGGGSVEASSLDPACAGYVAPEPTVLVDYMGTADLLRTFFYSDGDATLVIRTPTGAYRCGDDINQLILDPVVDLAEPAPGPYAVWVGSNVATDLIPGFLVFTTRANVDASGVALGNLVKRLAAPPAIPLRERVVNAAKRLEEAEAAVEVAAALEAGDVTVTQAFTASGELPAVELQTGQTLCGGLVNIKPDYAFDWSGAAAALTLFFEADADTTLLVRAPDGSFLCADDAAEDNLNPLLSIAEPAEGRYLVWIGRVNPDAPVNGVLTLTEEVDAIPAVLARQSGK